MTADSAHLVISPELEIVADSLGTEALSGHVVAREETVLSRLHVGHSSNTFCFLLFAPCNDESLQPVQSRISFVLSLLYDRN